MSLTISDIAQIQADAEKNVTRQFRDASEDFGWEPTPTPGDGTGEIAEALKPDPSKAELVAHATELGLDSRGTKAELQARIDEHLASQGDSPE